METKNTAKHVGSPGRKVRSPAKTNADRQNAKRGGLPKRNQRKSVLFHARTREAHESLDDAIRKIESGKMTPESAKEILEKIKIIQALLGAAKRELESWLKARKL